MYLCTDWIVGLTFVRITVTSEMTALSDVHAAIFGMTALKLDRPLLLLPGEVVGKADHLVKVEAELVGMDMPQLHRQVLGIMVEAKIPLGLLEARVEGLLPGVTLVGRLGSTVVLRILMELGTISVVPVSMVLPTEVALVTKGLALACDATGYPSSVASGGCRITSCTPIGALISTVVDKDRFHHKCNTIVLPAEPTADKLREWLSEIKERVRNAFSFDSDYALAWISETERLDYDALGGPCKYPILDSNFTSAIRECIKTRAVRDKMNRLTEAAQNMNPSQGIKQKKILKLLQNHLQTGVEDDQTFKIAELTSLKCRQTGHSDDEARLRSYLSTWDNLISGIRKKIDDGVLLAVFIENVRHLRCMRPDIERWDRDVTVRSFAWLYKACQDCVERWQKRQNTLQMYQTFHEQRSRSGSQSRERDRHPAAPAPVRRYDPLARKSDPSPSRSVRSGRDGRPDGKPRSSSPGRSSQRDRVSPGRGSQRDKRTPSPKSPRRQSPAGPADRACWEYTKTGKCQYGRECRFEHDKSPRNPAAPSTPRTGDRPVRDKPMFFGYCYDWMYGKCTAQPCKYLHQKPPPGTKPITPCSTAGPVVEDEEGDTPRSPTPSPPDREARRLDSPAQGLTDF